MPEQGDSGVNRRSLQVQLKEPPLKPSLQIPARLRGNRKRLESYRLDVIRAGETSESGHCT